MITKTSVIITLAIEGMHCFPKAAELFPEVAFLSDRHRHTFYFTASFKVTHSDRDKEFIILKRDVMNYLQKKYFDMSTRTHEFGSRSCEMLAEEVLHQFDADWVS